MAEESRLREYSRVALFSAIGATIITYLTCRSCSESWDKFTANAAVSTVMWMVMWIGNSELTQLISKKISWVHFPVKRLIVGLIATIVFTVGVAMLLLKFYEYSRGIKFTSITGFVVISLIITFLISFFLHGREFLLQWKKSAVEAERYQKESIAANYESLKAQVNPHFLFNSLNVLTNLVNTDQARAVQFIKKMSEVYRYLLDTRNQELVSLNDEMGFTESYIYMQRIRFGDNLVVQNQVGNVKGNVVPLAIQMLIENAIKHNEISSENPLQIKISSSPTFICVENTIKIRSNPLESSSGVGLENIKKRYEFLSSSRVEVIQSDGKFIVKVPLLSVADHD